VLEAFFVDAGTRKSGGNTELNPPLSKLILINSNWWR